MSESDSCELQHMRLLCPSLSPRVYSKSCPLPCHPLQPLSPLPSIFPSIRVFSNILGIRRLTYWNFSFSNSPSNEYLGLISFRIDWFDLLAVQGALQESSPAPQFKSVNSSVLSLLYGPVLTSVHDSRKDHSFD